MDDENIQIQPHFYYPAIFKIQLGHHSKHISHQIRQYIMQISSQLVSHLSFSLSCLTYSVNCIITNFWGPHITYTCKIKSDKKNQLNIQIWHY